jgi:hypothetical protein
MPRSGASQEPKWPRSIRLFLIRLWKHVRANATAHLVIATWFLVIVTAYFNRVTIGEQHSYNVASLRPYVVFEGSMVTNNATSITAAANWKNIGKTPALNARLYGWLYVFPQNDPTPVDSRPELAFQTMLQKERESGARYIALQTDVPMTAGNGPTTGSPEAITQITKSAWGWVFVGRATYTDDFRGSYETNFCIYPGGDGKVDYCQTHNDSN